MAASGDKSSSEGHGKYNQLTVGEGRERLVEALEPPDNIGQTGSRPEILLLQAQLLTDYKHIQGA